MKRIIFNLKREWYDKIASGEKTVEYRSLVSKNGKRSKWCAIFGMDPDRFYHEGDGFFADESVKASGLAPTDWFAVFRLGYSRKYPDIVRNIWMIDIGTCPYPGWSGEYFRIYFSKEGGAK